MINLQLCSDCLNEITEDKPGIIIIDNDNLWNDFSTGGNTSHCTNVMYVQQVSLKYLGPQCGECVKDAKSQSLTLKEIATGLQTHDCYITESRQSAIDCSQILSLKGSKQSYCQCNIFVSTSSVAVFEVIGDSEVM